MSEQTAEEQKSKGVKQRKPVSARTVRAAATTMLRVLKLSKAELSVLLCDDPTIHTLNKTYRNKDKPTDVLAFSMREGEGGERAGAVLGDVVVSLDTALRQAKEHNHSVKTEVFLLLAHGLLHLLGWDHQTDTEDRKMRAEVKRLVDAVTGSDITRTRTRSHGSATKRVSGKKRRKSVR